MKKIIIAIYAFFLCFAANNLKVQCAETNSFFNIVKVNRIKKTWVIPPDRRDFMGSHGIQKFDYIRQLPEAERGEYYVVSWSYRGKPVIDSLLLKFEFRTEKNIKDLYVKKCLYKKIKRGAYKITIKNIGLRFAQKGKIDRWRVSVLSGGKVVAEQRSFTWSAMEGN